MKSYKSIKIEDVSGSVFTGSDGDTDRQYVIPYSNIIASTFQIFVNGLLFHGTQYDLTSSTLTISSELYDENVVSLYFNIESTVSSSTLSYTTVYDFVKSLSLLKTIREAGSESYEEVGTGDNATSTFWLDNVGVIEDTYTLYYGSSYTELVEGTHYSIDLDTSKITLTAAGITLVGTDKIYAEYSYNIASIPNSELLRILSFAENQVLRRTEMTFANYSDDDPSYKKIENETHEGRFDARWKTFDMFYNPIVNFETTVNGAYTTGSTSITLTTTQGLPSSGIVTIDGNKVEYSDKTSTTLTIPAITPSIDDGSSVHGECIEISKESEGTTPSYQVLKRDIDYKIDFMQGRFELLGNAYFGEFQDSDRFYPANYMIRSSYMTAWYEKGLNPAVPDDIEQCTYMIASNRLMKSTVAKAHISGLNNFNPALVAVDRTDIDEILDYYKQINVGTSPFNRGSIS
jgi:hypothetical protein